jgi:hypothetical protein
VEARGHQPAQGDQLESRHAHRWPEEIQRSLAEMKTDLNNRFNTVAQNVVAVQHLIKIEGRWEKHQAQIDKIDDDVTRDSMLSFAKEIVAEKPHTMLADLNVVLTQGIPANRRPAARPLSSFRMANRSRGMGFDQDVMEAYEYTEKRFVDFRMREQKAYAMYLWAPSVLETNCNLNPVSAHSRRARQRISSPTGTATRSSRRRPSTRRSTGSFSLTPPTA